MYDLKRETNRQTEHIEKLLVKMPCMIFLIGVVRKVFDNWYELKRIVYITT